MAKMKESGFEWIGQIPEEWLISKGKYLFKIDTGKLDANAEDIDGVYPFFTCSMYPKKINSYSFDCEALLVAGNGLVGYTQYYNGKFDAYQRTYVLSDFENVNPGYLKYFTTSILSKEVDPKKTGSVIQFIKLGDLENFHVCIPPASAQEKIVRFLDVKCSEIDALHSDIEKQIETLEEYKKSVITEAVTKGLNPDAEMKDSGIEWIGMIPKHWDVHPVYSYFGERKNKNKLGRETNLLSLSYGNVIRKDINTNGGLLPENFNSYNIVEANDIIIRPTDLQNDKHSLRTGLAMEHGIITSAYIDLCPKENVNSAYFHYLLHAYDLMKVFYNMGNGVRQGLNYSEFSRLMVFEPTSIEQQEIVDYLDSKCVEIDGAIEDKKKQLETLEEYKKSLIYEYVTGKKEVPDNE